MSDLIDRQAAIDAITEIDDGINMDIYTNEVRELLREVPSVQPDMSGNMGGTHKSLDCISRQMARDALNQLSRDNFSLGDWFQTYLTALIAADDAIQRLPSVQRWIPVTERLPEDGVAVLTTTENAEIHIDYVITDGFGERYFLNNTAYDDFDVTAWMPLPECYKGGQEK